MSASSDPAQSKRHTPQIALFSALGPADLLDSFPGRFRIQHCHDKAGLAAELQSAEIDLVILDCRDELPGADVVEHLLQDEWAEFLAVGCPTTRRNIPKNLATHWCPWPVDRRSFYRLVKAMTKKSKWKRAYRLQKQHLGALAREAALGRKLAQTLHEINNPLDAVMRFVRLAKKAKADEERDRLMEGAQMGLERMAAAMSALHGESRRASSELMLEELDEVIFQALTMSSILEVSGIRFRNHLKLEGVKVPRALSAVFLNLLQNARRACGDQGRIEITGRLSGDKIIIDVSDNGEGFAELFSDELFKPYFTTRNDDGLGLGMGLATARTQLEQLGGSLDANSEGIGKGAVFRVTLPIFSTDKQNEYGQEHGA